MTTKFVTATYQEVYDLGTVAGKVSVLGIHTPDGSSSIQSGGVYNMLSGFFSQYRKYRYTGCTVAMIPAAQLPADPLQISYEAGEAAIDPRDLLNPILFHGCHGENLNEVLNSVYARSSSGGGINSISVNRQDLDAENNLFGLSVNAEDAYYSALSDPSFRKFGVQSGLKVNLRPMVHPLAMSFPLVPNAGVGYTYDPQLQIFIPSNGAGEGQLSANGNIGSPTHDVPSSLYFQDGGGQGVPATVFPQMFTTGLRPLGWLPTAQLGPDSGQSVTFQTPSDEVKPSDPGIVFLPRIFMGLIILPPSYKQELYFRMVITHFFQFKDFSTSLSIGGAGRHSYTNGLPDSVTGGDAGTSSIEALNANVIKTTEGVF